jgi:arabinose-5-phosphate isomerase
MTEITKEQALQLARKTLRQEIDSLQSLEESLGDSFWQVAQLLSSSSGLIWMTAVGTSDAVAARFAHILTCCGVRAMTLPPSDGLHGHAGIIQPGDILIAMSRGGESADVIQMAVIANDRGAMTVAFVHDTASSLAHACRYILPIQSPQEHELLGLLATTSTVVFSAMCDALCAVVAEAKGFSPEEFAKIHPAGAVGKALTGT